MMGGGPYKPYMSILAMSFLHDRRMPSCCSSHIPFASDQCKTNNFVGSPDLLLHFHFEETFHLEHQTQGQLGQFPPDHHQLFLLGLHTQTLAKCTGHAFHQFLLETLLEMVHVEVLVASILSPLAQLHYEETFQFDLNSMRPTGALPSNRSTKLVAWSP